MYMHCYAFSICQLPNCNLFTQHVIYLYGEIPLVSYGPRSRKLTTWSSNSHGDRSSSSASTIRDCKTWKMMRFRIREERDLEKTGFGDALLDGLQNGSIVIPSSESPRPLLSSGPLSHQPVHLYG
jgi:hypothetical protein